MTKLAQMSNDELLSMHSALVREFDKIKAKELKLNMARGKPGRDQVALSSEMLTILTPEVIANESVDVANYGVLDGIPSCKKLFAEILGVKEEEVFVGGNASLALMYDIIAKAYTHGLYMSDTPWAKLDKVKFICPAPGYDRHFAISESFGMEMITVPLLNDGPDMKAVAELIKDPAVKGMWCVPKYSNPDGVIYSDETVRAIAAMKPAAKDFLLMWDNAYCIHEFDGEFVPFLNILDECAKVGNPNMPFEFTSTSKITIPGAGVGCFATSVENMTYIKKLIGVQTIGYDKLNQLRHVLFLKNKEGALLQMKKHAKILKPKFQIVLDALENEIAPLDIAKWHTPKGGYFVSLYAMNGTAKRVYTLCKEAGVVMTAAGATYPHGNDPDDSHMRIAPTLPPVNELKEATQVLCTALKLAAVEKLLGKI